MGHTLQVCALICDLSLCISLCACIYVYSMQLCFHLCAFACLHAVCTCMHLFVSEQKSTHVKMCVTVCVCRLCVNLAACRLHLTGMECDVFVLANSTSAGLTFSHYLIRGGVDRQLG